MKKYKFSFPVFAMHCERNWKKYLIPKRLTCDWNPPIYRWLLWNWTPCNLSHPDWKQYYAIYVTHTFIYAFFMLISSSLEEGNSLTCGANYHPISEDECAILYQTPYSTSVSYWPKSCADVRAYLTKIDVITLK